ncbi:MAG: di-heme oxidoredictase family protein, partial [Pseudomonadota bacterium]
SVLKTRPHPSDELSEQLVWAYSDLMLHDMGTELAEAGNADDSSEWRTAPLWGVGYVERHLPEHGFLHDGRARNLEEAVLWHGGEAAAARQRFVALEKSDREALLRYLRSL